MFPIIFSIFLIIIIIYDFIFLDKSARRALLLLSFLFLIAVVFCIYPIYLVNLAKLLGVGRGVDLLTYLSIVILTREYIINRAKRSNNEEKYIALVRKIAIINPIKITFEKNKQKISL